MSRNRTNISSSSDNGGGGGYSSSSIGKKEVPNNK